MYSMSKAKFDVYILVDFISTNEHGVNYTYVVKVVGFLCLMLILFCFLFNVSSDLHLHCLIML